MINEFVAFDFETAKSKHPCSLGLAKFSNGTLINQLYLLFNPNITDWNPINISIHGIKPVDVENSPLFSEVQNQIIEFIADFPLVGHQCSSDFSTLEFCSGNNATLLQRKFYCTLKYSKSALNLDKNGLKTVVQQLGIASDFNEHNALSDAVECGKLFQYLLDNHPHKLEDSVYDKYKIVENRGFYFRGGVTLIDASEIEVLSASEKTSFLSLQNVIFLNMDIIPSGTFVNFSRDEISKIIQNCSGRKMSSLSKKTAFMISGQEMGPSKLQKAEELNIPLINEQEFIDNLRQIM